MSVLTLPTIGNINSAAKSTPLLTAITSSEITEKVSIEERTILLLVRDLVRLGWNLRSTSSNSIEFVPPECYEKSVVKKAMSFSRNEIIERDASWIESHIGIARANLATGVDALKSKIIPRIEVCEKQSQHNLFRILRYGWSSPASDYVGRRIRLIVRDDGIKGSPVIGIAALGSSIIHIPDRDRWIGWDIKTRTERIIYMMDAYVIGAMPPYNHLLGGKLMSYILASNELREIYKRKYLHQTTLIRKRKAHDLVLIATSSLYGKNSSQYNRIKYGKSLLYKPIGVTSGYGTLHISNETFDAMKELATANGHNTSNKFGMGPNWRMRVIRAACDELNLNSDIILKHSFQRGLFAVPLANNYKAFLNGNSKSPRYRSMRLDRLTNYWRKRWLSMRKKNSLVCKKVAGFHPESFKIQKTNV